MRKLNCSPALERDLARPADSREPFCDAAIPVREASFPGPLSNRQNQEGKRVNLKNWSMKIAVALAVIAAGTAAGHAKVYRGPAAHVGNGTIRAVVVTDASNHPTAYGVEFTAAMLKGLPAKPGSDPELDWNYTLTLPKDAPATGVNPDFSPGRWLRVFFCGWRPVGLW